LGEFLCVVLSIGQERLRKTWLSPAAGIYQLETETLELRIWGWIRRDILTGLRYRYTLDIVALVSRFAIVITVA